MPQTYQHLAEYLIAFKNRFEPVFAALLQKKVEEMNAIDASGGKMTELIARFSKGGKRLRAALVAVGYEAAGNAPNKNILAPAAAMELLHTFFLIHDDIMDRSDTRRGFPTVHRLYETEHSKQLKTLPENDQEHFVVSMALLAGDLCCAIAYETLATSKFSPDRILATIMRMHAMIDATVTGQALDTIRPLNAGANPEEVEKIHILKTAKYTVEGPLQMGMVLGNAPEHLVEAVSAYATPVGAAFQIQDDILGVFGSEKELGKPVASDLSEGKQTLLTAHVQIHGTPRQRDEINEILRKQTISAEELDQARAIMRESGALGETESRARELIQQAKKTLKDMRLPSEASHVLEELADYVIDRTM